MRLTTASAVTSLLVASASAQYTSDFESLAASAAGTALTGQDGFYLPPATTSVDFNAFTYAGNALGISMNASGGAQFIAANGPGSPTFARAQRDIALSTGVWTLGFDINASYLGTLPSAQNVGSISLQPSTTSSFFIALARWTDPTTAATWNADYQWYDSTGAVFTESVGNPAFQNLAVNTWYRWETDFDLASGAIVEVRLTDIGLGTTTAFNPVDRYLNGGAGGATTPTSFRFFAGGGVPGNTLGFDNAHLAPKTLPPDIIHYKFDNGDATNSATGSVGDGVVGAGVQFEANGGLCVGAGAPAAGVAATGATCQVDTGWTTDLGTSDWTVGMFFDRRGSLLAPTTIQYAFGNSSASSFRCFVGGVAGATGFLLRGTGIPDCNIPNGGTMAKPVHVVWCYDAVAAQLRGYLDGQLAVTTAVPVPLNVNGTTNFTMMRYNGSTGSLSPGVIVDDFRFYRRCISEAELRQWQACGFGPLGATYCDPSVANSTGNRAQIAAYGSTIVELNLLELEATNLPMNSFGYFLASQTPDNVPMSGGSSGTLCLGGSIGRGVGGVVLNSGAAGAASVHGDLTMQPQPMGPVAVVPGDTWYYQYWYRDANPNVTSNFTDAVRVTYE